MSIDLSRKLVLLGVLLFGFATGITPTLACIQPHDVIQLGERKSLNFLVPDSADVIFIGSVREVDNNLQKIIFDVEKPIRGVKAGEKFTADLLSNSFQCGSISPGEIWWEINIPKRTPTAAPPMPSDYMKNAISMNYDGSNRQPTPKEEKEKLWMSEWLRQFQHQANGVFLRDAHGIYDEGTNKILIEKFGYDIAAPKTPIVKTETKKNP